MEDLNIDENKTRAGQYRIKFGAGFVLGIGIGVAIGVAMGAAWNNQARKETDNQDEE